MARWPWAWTPPCIYYLASWWGKVALEDRRALQAWHYELDSAARGPCLAALLVSRGYLDQFLRTFGQEAASRTAASNVLGSLRKAAADALTATSKAASEGTPAVEEAVARDRLQQALQAYAGTTPLRYPSLSNVQQHVLPPARQLAAALLDWWRRPSAQQEQQLEAAQAAAARSCAYLGCTNLGGGGGPAAGQGEGSMRCSACRAVWYCGTACSHADWRVGHKRVCKALGTARAAAKAARRQAAEPAGEAAEQPA